MKNWQTIGEKLIYDNKWINLTEYDVINPNGGNGIYGKVHFKNTAIGIVALDEKMNIFIVGQQRYATNSYSWEIPEGGGPIGTDVLESAKRELLEETGLKATKWKQIIGMHLSNSVSDEWGVVFLATDLSQHEAMPEETEDLIVKSVPFDEAYDMVENGIITDSMSVAAIYKIKLMQLKGVLDSI